MATPFDVQLRELPADERAEIHKLLADHPRDVWHSDEGDGLAFHLLFGLAALGGAVACVVEIQTSLAYSPLGEQTLLLLGLTLCTALLGLLLWRFSVLHGRHGWLLTSFAYIRVRGPSLRLVRWQDITRVQRRVIGSGRGKFAMVELTTPNGTLASDTAIFFNDIRRRVHRTTTVEE